MNLIDWLIQLTRNYYDYLPLVIIAACTFISISSMLSLFIFNIFIHRHNPFTAIVRTNGHLGSNHHISYSPNVNDLSKNEIFKCVTSFALGAILSDVFFHLLPEATELLNHISSKDVVLYQGKWILIGLFCEPDEKISLVNNDNGTTNGLKHRKNTNKSNGAQLASVGNVTETSSSAVSNIKFTGYLNIIANGMDNFMHGMSVGGSFLVSFKAGCLTTLSIIIHEIPHEIADNVVLLRSGFSVWKAFMSQLGLSLATIFGSLTPLYFKSTEKPSWILPITAGGFIHIACCGLLPEVFKVVNEDDTTLIEPFKRLCWRIFFILLGSITMSTINDLIEFTELNPAVSN
ncbi:hypothetical protein RDWZM_003993 [Blomia tropicalis]|uniref:Zinc transporter ZIP13 n=1 Tax=Blomia tropicalis TaxID=40697 RepID=A0A9Q0MHX8_BLOTA|nr:hypothetical protein RDWZM_003993 [Blomia tropicalis]